MAYTTIFGRENAYTTASNLNNAILIGRENGYEATNLNNSILLGYRQGYNTGAEGAAAYRLAIGMYEDNALIYGEFDNEVLKVNGNLTVTDRAGTAAKSAFFDTNGKLVEGDIQEISSIDMDLSVPSSYLGKEDTYYNTIVNFNVTSGWETGDDLQIYVFGPDSGGYDTSAEYLYVGDKGHGVLNADYTITSFIGGYIVTSTDRYGSFGYETDYNLTSSDYTSHVYFVHRNSSGVTKSDGTVKKILEGTRGTANKMSVITTPLPFNTVMKAPILTTTERDAALLTDVATDRGKIIYNDTEENLEFWDGTDWVGVGGSSGGGIDSSLSKVDQDVDAARLVEVTGKLTMRSEASGSGVVVSASSTISGSKYSALNVNTSSSSSDGFYAIQDDGIRIRVGDEGEGRILYSNSNSGDAVWGQADNVGRITTTLSLWSDERQVLLAGTAYSSFGAFTFPPSNWTTSHQHDGDVLTLINRSGSTRQLTGDIEGTTSTTVDVLDDDTIRLVYYAGGDYWIVLSNN